MFGFWQRQIQVFGDLEGPKPTDLKGGGSFDLGDEASGTPCCSGVFEATALVFTRVPERHSHIRPKSKRRGSCLMLLGFVAGDMAKTTLRYTKLYHVYLHAMFVCCFHISDKI